MMAKKKQTTPSFKRKSAVKRAATKSTILIGDYSVYLDVVFEQGLFFLVLHNSNPFPVFNVSVRFNRNFFGVNLIEGTKKRRPINDLDIFKTLSFLAPQKHIKIFVDTSASYFKRKQPTIIRATVTHRNPEGKKRKNTMLHNLKVYKDFEYIVKSDHE